jgi:hypothetical protein
VATTTTVDGVISSPQRWGSTLAAANLVCSRCSETVVAFHVYGLRLLVHVKARVFECVRGSLGGSSVVKKEGDDVAFSGCTRISSSSLAAPFRAIFAPISAAPLFCPPDLVLIVAVRSVRYVRCCCAAVPFTISSCSGELCFFAISLGQTSFLFCSLFVPCGLVYVLSFI